jgi:hypothetical protein
MSTFCPAGTSFVSLGSALGTLTLLFTFSTLAAAQIRLLPAPREASFGPETPLPVTIAVSVPARDAEDQFAARDLEEAVKQTAPIALSYFRTGLAEAKALLIWSDPVNFCTSAGCFCICHLSSTGPAAVGAGLSDD